ncbi:peroxiredoxin [Chlorobium phaeobacteroides]|jgi:peroxiredoxin (alkyl hydroperoxide reductase subunit C)|uniref:Thioredoxin peroxidase n=1 Tax=Chlorobium phaeobacteroides (strain DSM 266 / SMG 266 / 2430) TaxID=290317 RepID=A1BHL7_CHLPD|nr:peroxiredoxin [Chlorobium phaeobacteroides]ABL65894.1 alkyl hydroperoxide reductase/ Thiol specific antioxidant/ Mal allergen [Chlorobium phaeobacteroides DSM 266]MBV5329261.1 peroxiredoxin [Chlorobium sp.]
MGVLVGRKAPEFCVEAVTGGSRFVDACRLSDYAGKYVVLFFYPLDFTFVCPTELHAFQDKLDEFTKRNVEVIGCSVDSKFSHFAWLQTPRNRGGIEGVTYTLLSDINKTVSSDYDVLVDGAGISLRGLFLIDREGVVRHQVVNDLGLGRNVDEVLRMIDALQFTEEFGEVCPANWNKGDKTMKPDDEGLKEFFKDA